MIAAAVDNSPIALTLATTPQPKALTVSKNHIAPSDSFVGVGRGDFSAVQNTRRAAPVKVASANDDSDPLYQTAAAPEESHFQRNAIIATCAVSVAAAVIFALVFSNPLFLLLALAPIPLLMLSGAAYIVYCVIDGIVEMSNKARATQCGQAGCY